RSKSAAITEPDLRPDCNVISPPLSVLSPPARARPNPFGLLNHLTLPLTAEAPGGEPAPPIAMVKLESPTTRSSRPSRLRSPTVIASGVGFAGEELVCSDIAPLSGWGSNPKTESSASPEDAPIATFPAA